MALIADYVITPDVFDVTSYSSEEICGLQLGRIKDTMLDEGLVRDLRAGEWRRLFGDSARPWHRRASEIVKKLYGQGRLVSFPPMLAASPADDRGWCAEALASHRSVPMAGGVVATASIKDAYLDESVVECIDALPKARWWTGRGSSVRLERSLAAYRQNLDLILRHARSLQFIDPHLDPRESRYRGVVDLLAHAGKRSPPPRVEIHRVCYRGSGPNRQVLDREDLEGAFRDALASPLGGAGLQAEILIWDDFHDRYLVSNLIGIGMPNGFDTSGKPGDLTTWTRLSRTDRDDVQREFEEASGRHQLRFRFTVP